MDEIDYKILQILIKNSRTPFTDIAKKLIISAGTVHIRVKKLEEMGVIKGATLIIDYEKLGYTFIAYVGMYVDNSTSFRFVIEEIKKIPEVTVTHLTTGKFALFCKIRAKSTRQAKDIIFRLDEINGVIRTETSISLEEVVNDKERLMNSIIDELKN